MTISCRPCALCLCPRGPEVNEYLNYNSVEEHHITATLHIIAQIFFHLFVFCSYSHRRYVSILNLMLVLVCISTT